MSSIPFSIPAALGSVAHLSLESTPALAQRVVAHAKYANAVGPKKTNVLPITGGPASVLSSGIDLLREASLALAPPPNSTTPVAVQHWAIARWSHVIGISGAATPQSPLLASTPAVTEFRYHHMTALSEGIGVGTAVACANAWLEVNCPPGTTIDTPVDLEYVLGSNSHPGQAALAALVAQVPHSTRRPDLAILATDPSTGAQRVLIVECKGSSRKDDTSPDQAAIRQLASAMSQLGSVSSSMAAGADYHAYATLVSKSGGPLRVLGVDPPDGEDPWVPASPETEADLDRALFARAVREVGIERRARWAGISSDVERETFFGSAVGSSSRFALIDGGYVEVFTGIGPIAETSDDRTPRFERDAVAGRGRDGTILELRFTRRG